MTPPPTERPPHPAPAGAPGAEPAPPAAGGWPDDGRVRLMRWSPRCTVLGPGARAVFWVQGCPLRCPGCVAPESLPFDGGETWAVEDVARVILDLPGIDGVTFSGGDPMAQAAPLCAVIDRVRARRDVSFLSYTGFTAEWLVEHGSPAQHDLLRRLDILIDGPYVRARHTDRRWRGSDNQRVLFLTARHRDWAPRVNDRGTWLEFETAEDSVAWMGIPPPGFRERFEDGMARQGVRLSIQGAPPLPGAGPAERSADRPADYPPNFPTKELQT